MICVKPTWPTNCPYISEFFRAQNLKIAVQTCFKLSKHQYLSKESSNFEIVCLLSRLVYNLIMGMEFMNKFGGQIGH